MITNLPDFRQGLQDAMTDARKQHPEMFGVDMNVLEDGIKDYLMSDVNRPMTEPSQILEMMREYNAPPELIEALETMLSAGEEGRIVMVDMTTGGDPEKEELFSPLDEKTATKVAAQMMPFCVSLMKIAQNTLVFRMAQDEPAESDSQYQE